MNRNQRREAHTLKRWGEDAFLCRASGNHLAAQNDELEPEVGGEAPVESATEYAQRRARENDARAFSIQLNGSGVRPW